LTDKTFHDKEDGCIQVGLKAWESIRSLFSCLLRCLPSRRRCVIMLVRRLANVRGNVVRIPADLCALALRGLVGGACKALGSEAGAAAGEGVVVFLMRHFVDHSQKLLEALHHANERAWRALEVALAGDGLWDRCKLVLASGDEKAFREQVRPFLDGCSLSELQGRDAFRQSCLNELRAARKAGLLTEGKLDPANLARKAGAFARFSDPHAVLEAEHQ